ncbi:MAG: hypothetical protein RLZZ628_1093 [Bacteroidota bacterium]|jgi:uncharacterized membrane protein
MATMQCYVSKQDYDGAEVRVGAAVRQPIFNLIKKDFPNFTTSDYISIESLNIYRQQYIEQIINNDNDETTALEKQIIKSLTDHEIIAHQLLNDEQVPLSFGQRLSDKIALFGGSWTFIISFFLFLMCWMLINSVVKNGFDTYPFIFLNLILSCLAAIQAPIIMMSQNRQSEKDRLHAYSDYKTNLKSEVEIRMLHEKIDHLMNYQGQKLLEIQQIQAEYMSDILKTIQSENHSMKAKNS